MSGYAQLGGVVNQNRATRFLPEEQEDIRQRRKNSSLGCMWAWPTRGSWRGRMIDSLFSLRYQVVPLFPPCA